MNLYRIIIPVPDIEKAEQFYTFLLDQAGQRISPGRHYYDLGGTILACYDPEADGDETGQRWTFHENQYTYIAVADIDSLFKKVRQNSAATLLSEAVELMPWGERLFYLQDPFGTPLCFVDESTVFKGA